MKKHFRLMIDVGRKKPLNMGRLIPLIFMIIILAGTALLALPVSSRNGQSCGLMTALFTATSSTCVTGLSLTDTWTQWSPFGQGVLLLLIEIGGLGFMSAASMVIFVFRRKMSLTTRLAIAQSIGSGGAGSVVRVQRNLLIGSLGVEGAGAVLLTFRFARTYPFGKALWMGVFHSISAYCNAGFDLLGFIEPGSSMIHFGQDPAVLLTLSFLIVTGSIGFLVWDEIFRLPYRRWSVYTRLVLITTASLLLGGMVLILITEWNNPGTLGGFDVPGKLLAAFFQSVTTRTAGFAGIDQGLLSEGGKGVTIFLMLIGGSSGSTAGGLKTVTFVTLVLFLWNRMKGRDTVSAFKRTIPMKQVLDALTLFCVMVILAFTGAVLLCATTSGLDFLDALYETVSALATVGLTAGITTQVSLASRILLIIFMFFGRVGILTISLGFLQGKQSGEQFRYASTSLLIG